MAKSFFFSGGFYSDSVAHVDDRCFLYNPGTYVPPEKAPGRRVLDCQVCPPGNIIVTQGRIFSLTLRQMWKIWRSLYPGSSREINWYPGACVILKGPVHMSRIEFEFRPTQINLDRLN